MGTLATDEQAKSLENHCNTKGPEDLTKFENVPFHVINNMINEAKEAVKVESKEAVKVEPKEDMPKRKRRTKAEIEADNEGK